MRNALLITDIDRLRWTAEGACDTLQDTRVKGDYVGESDAYGWTGSVI